MPLFTGAFSLIFPPPSLTQIERQRQGLQTFLAAVVNRPKYQRLNLLHHFLRADQDIDWWDLWGRECGVG